MIIDTLSERQLGKPKFYSIIYETIFFNILYVKLFRILISAMFDFA